MRNHGATDSSNQWVTSLPGVDTVGCCDGSRGSCSFHVTSLPDPCRLEMNLMIGSSCPTYLPLSSNRAGLPFSKPRGSLHAAVRCTGCCTGLSPLQSSMPVAAGTNGVDPPAAPADVVSTSNAAAAITPTAHHRTTPNRLSVLMRSPLWSAHHNEDAESTIPSARECQGGGVTKRLSAEVEHSAGRRARAHSVHGLLDLVQRQPVRDQLVEREPAALIEVEDQREVVV